MNNKSSEYQLSVPENEPRHLATAWLFLAVGALIMGGLLTILIVMSRTPGLQSIIPWTDFFHTAIVVHVDLTVLVWFLAIAGVFWSISCSTKYLKLAKLAFYITVTGTVVFAISPFVGADKPLMNNYVPVLQHPMFLIGLAIFGVGFLLLIIRSLSSFNMSYDWDSGEQVLRFGIFTAIVAALLAMLCLLLTYLMMPAESEGHSYYELLFWGSGHVLQFTHTQLMLVAWLWLATIAGVKHALKPKFVFILFAVGFSPILFSPVIYYLYDVSSAEHIVAFTRLMEAGGGIAALPLGLMLVIGLLRLGWPRGEAAPHHMALIFSILLFAAGGIIGFLISGVNVTIPAHYHGSIVAVTLSFMGVCYYLLPKLGFQKPSIKWARRQPLIYGGGQLLHVLGLAWSGGYGVQRKTAGAAQGLESIPEIAGMALMGLGGLISVVGGMLFLIIVIKAVWPGKQKLVAMGA